MFGRNATSGAPFIGPRGLEDGGLRSAPGPIVDIGGAPDRVDTLSRKSTFDGNQLAVPEADPERIAFQLWNEGRIDEAVEFLEREVAAERDRRRETARDEAAGLPVSGNASAATVNTPVSGWRERHRAALSPADFSAYGTSLPTIDITPGPADAIVPPKARRSLRPAWIMGLCLAAVLGVSAGAAFWTGRDGNTALPSTQPTASIEPSTTAPSVAEPQEQTVTAAKPEAEIAAAPPPEEDLAVAESASTPAAGIPPAPEMPGDAVAAMSPAPATTEPETTSSIEPTPAAEPPLIVEARLPQPRPEPPVYIEEQSPVPVLGAKPPLVYTPRPEPIYAPPRLAPGEAPFFEPRATLTPEEHQALLERRAWATDYVARRRAVAERSALTVRRPPFELTLP